MSAGLWMLTRKFPPGVGGMQQLSFHLVHGLAARRAVHLVAWRGGRWGLPWFFLGALLQVLAGLLARRISVLHLGDPALAVLAFLPRRFGVPVAVTVHGLDVTYPAPVYQWYLRRFFWGRMDAYICISQHVRNLVLAAGVPPEQVSVIPVGIAEPPAGDPAEAALPASLAAAFPVIVSVGRLVRRKGLDWFLTEVAGPWLVRHPQARLVITGDGPMRARIERLAKASPGAAQVIVTGEISEPRKWALMRRADLLVMPNVAIAGDAEGFGLVALEAASAGTFVLAADLEGLRDAVADDCNGRRVPAGDAGAWSRALDELCVDREALKARGAAARVYVSEHFSWRVVIARYDQLLRELEVHAT